MDKTKKKSKEPVKKKWKDLRKIIIIQILPTEKSVVVFKGKV